MPDTPLDLLRSFIPPDAQADIERKTEALNPAPQTARLGDLKTPIYGRDPTELLAHRFLYRGAVCLLLGPTGIGKSSLLMQFAIHWAVGRGVFGLNPGAVYLADGMRILLIQAENDEGDLAEMRDGVLAGCTDLTDVERAEAVARIDVATVCDKTGEAFRDLLDSLLTSAGPYEMVMVDPAFAYLGGKSNSQEDVSRFMRAWLNPILQRHQTGMLLAHHSNKPLRGEEKGSWSAGDYAYLGAGSAEWINPSRAALAIRSLGSDDVFEFRAVKRGKRAGWRDEHDQPTTVQHIAHHGDPGVICWREATPGEIEDVTTPDATGRPKRYDEIECVHAVLAHPRESQATYVSMLCAALDCSPTTAKRLLRTSAKKGWLTVHGDAHFRRFGVSDSGRDAAETKVSAHAWTK